MRSRDALLLALVAAFAGTGAGFAIASLFEGPRPVQASGPAAVQPSAVSPRPAAAHGPAPAAELREVERTTAVALAAEVAPRVAQAELERALDTVRAPRVEVAEGGGSITGEVVDEWGAPLAGVVVVASHLGANRAEDPSALGGAAPEETSLEEHLRKTAERWAETRGRTRRATSGSDGHFELSGLVEDASYNLNAYLQGHVVASEVQAWGITSGQHLVFRAEQVHEVPLQLVYEGGGVPSEGVVAVKRGNEERLYTWTADAPALRLTPGRVRLRGYGGQLRTQGSRGEVESTHASQEQSVEVLDQDGVTLQLLLAPRSGIRGRVVDPTGQLDRRHVVRLLALVSEGELDLDDLAQSNRVARLQGGRFSLLDLTPSTYAVGLTDSGGVLIAHELVRVDQGIVDLELALPEPDPERHLIVRAYGPSGRMLRDLEFHLASSTGDDTRDDRLQGTRDSDGAWWLRPRAEYFEPWGGTTTYTLNLRHSEFGEHAVALAQGQREVEATFAEPVSLHVTINGYASSRYVGKLQVTVEHLDGQETAQSAAQRMQFMRGRSGGNLSSEGTARIENLAPGRWRVNLAIQSENWQTRAVSSTEVLATSGEQRVTLDLPQLYDLVVIAVETDEEEYLFLSGPVQDGDPESFDSNLHAQVGDGGRAVFRGLVAGDYKLRGSGMYEAVDVRVPCAEVRLEDHAPDCLRVAIGDLEGALYQAGLRAGDLILAVDGAPVGASASVFDALVGSGELQLTVLRDGRTSTITFPRLPNGTEWWTALGGMLTPTRR